MARQVLAFGALAVVLLLAVWVMHVMALSEFAPMMHPPLSRTEFVVRSLEHGEGSPFAGLGAALWFWFALLGVATVCDFYVKTSDRALVGSFADALGRNMDGAPPLRQTWEGFICRTATSGIHEGRRSNVWIRRGPGGRTRPRLNVDVECGYQGVLSVRRRGLRFFMLSPIGPSFETNDPELDRMISLQADDADAVLGWIRKPEVRNRIIDLFESKGVDLLTVEDTADGRVLRAVYSRLFSERAEIQQTAPAVLAEIAALASSCESMATTAG
jgi:hypothetical protein